MNQATFETLTAARNEWANSPSWDNKKKAALVTKFFWALLPLPGNEIVDFFLPKEPNDQKDTFFKDRQNGISLLEACMATGNGPLTPAYAVAIADRIGPENTSRLFFNILEDYREREYEDNLPQPGLNTLRSITIEYGLSEPTLQLPIRLKRGTAPEIAGIWESMFSQESLAREAVRLNTLCDLLGRATDETRACFLHTAKRKYPQGFKILMAKLESGVNVFERWGEQRKKLSSATVVDALAAKQRLAPAH